MADLAPGASWGSFRIERLVGRGPAGTVYRASPSAGGKPVTLKIFHDSLPETVLMRFEDDSRRLVGLSHPNILRVESVGREGGRRFVVAEAFDARSLRELGPRPPKEACEIFLQVARAMGAAWMRLVLHRNLKPENVLVSAPGEVKLTDFGLFQDATPYWSPERKTGQSPDMRSDLYSLGTMFRESLSDRTPDVDAFLHQLTRTETYERIQMIEDAVSRLETILARMTAPPPAPVAPPPPLPPPVVVLPPMPEMPQIPKPVEPVPIPAAETDRRVLRMPDSPQPPPAAPPPMRQPDPPAPVPKRSAVLPILGTMLLFALIGAMAFYRLWSKLERERVVQAESRKARPKPAEPKRPDPPAPAPVNSRAKEDWAKTREAIRALEDEMKYAEAADMCERFLQRHGSQAPAESRKAQTDLRYWANTVQQAGVFRKQAGRRAVDLLETAGPARAKDRDRVLAKWCEEDWAETVRVVEEALANSNPYQARTALVRFLKLPHEGGIHNSEAEARQLGLLAEMEFTDVSGKAEDFLRANRIADAVAAWDGFLDQPHKGGARREEVEKRLATLREELKRTIYAGRSTIGRLALSPDGKRVAFTADRFRVYDVATRTEVASQTIPSLMRSMSFAGDSLVATAFSYRIAFWDPEKKAEARAVKITEGAVAAMAVTRDGKRMFVVRTDGSLSTWEGDAETPSKVEKGAAPGVTMLVLSPDGTKAAMAGVRDKTVRVRDLASGEEKKWTASAAALAWSPDGSRLATAGPESVVVWDPAKGEEVHALQGHKGAVTCVAFTSDGARIASAGADKSIRLWNAKDGSSAGVLAGHQERVTALVARPGGGLISSGADGIVKIWTLVE